MEWLDSGSLLDPSISKRSSLSPSKTVLEKRSGLELNTGSESTSKRIKIQNLYSALCSKEIKATHSESPNKELVVHARVGTKEATAQTAEASACMPSDRLPEGTTDQSNLTQLDACGHVESGQSLCNNSRSDTLSVYVTNVSGYPSASKKLEKGLDLNVSVPSDFRLDLNEDYVSNGVEQDPFYPYKSLDHVKLRQPSECGSSSGPLEDNEPLKMWKAMKQNGFLSSSHGGIPRPKKQGQSRKKKNDLQKKKIELAKKEQVDRFKKIAAPSGLLTGLNPGIINHVRNSRQVQSIIEALVRSEKLDKHCQSRSGNQIQMRRGSNEVNDMINCPKEMHDLVAGEPSNIIAETRETGVVTSLNNLSTHSCSEQKGGGEFDVAERRIFYESSIASQFTLEHEVNTLPLRFLSAATSVSDNGSCTSIEELLANQDNINSLAIKGATVASRWLELIQQDIKGRLAALKRSKKRVRSVIQRELPSLVSKELILNRQHDPFVSQSSGSACSINATPDMHMTRWRSIFNQMDKALSEEGKQLENWLKQVNQMQLHCEQGLQCMNIMDMDALQHPGSLEKDFRSKKAEALVRAAAASIYSTCNFSMTTENVSCF